MSPKFFQIGFNKCGTTFIASLFEMNDIPVVHWLKGDLAEDIAYSKLTGRKPLQRWADKITAFTDMESVRFLNTPIVEAFKEYEYLDQQFPGSVFMLNTRNVEDWIISRYMHIRGSYARACAQHHGVAVADLADFWKADWDRHLQNCRAYFGERPEFIEINIDEAQPLDYRDALSQWFDLKHLPKPRSASAIKKREDYYPKLAQMLLEPDVSDLVSDADRTEISPIVAKFCCPDQIRCHASEPAPDQKYPVQFLPACGEVKANGHDRLPILRGQGGRFYCDPNAHELRSIAAVANDIAETVDHGEYWLDMRNEFLTENALQPASGLPVIAACRKAGAANVFLWPMPWLHRLGGDQLPGHVSREERSFERKIDKAVWSGAVGGFARGASGPDLTRPLNVAVRDILAAPLEGPMLKKSQADLASNSRLDFVNRFARSEFVDVHIAPKSLPHKALRKAGMMPVLPTERKGASVFDYRYVISLSGFPQQNHFLLLANSHSVVLKEEDGLEFFHTPAFSPWVHYIPLQWGAEDLEEKLTWAKAHPEACVKMTEAARKRCLLLADPAGRRQQLSLILDAYLNATGQGG